MGLHLCPIEPDNWSNGPDGGNEGCEVCGGSGVAMVATGNKETPFLPIPCDCTTTHEPQYFDDDVI